MTIVNAAVGDVEGAIVEVLACPDDDPDRGRRAAVLLRAVMHAQAYPLYRYIDALLAVADANPPAGSGWPQTRLQARVVWLLHTLGQPVCDIDAIDRELAALAGQVAGDQALVTAVRALQLGLVVRRAAETDNQSVQVEMHRFADELASLVPDTPAAVEMAESFQAAVEINAAQRRGDYGAIQSLTSAVQRMIASLPTDHPSRAMMAEILPVAQMLAALVNDDGSLRRDRLSEVPATAFDEPMAGHHGADTLLKALMGIGMAEESDLQRIDEGITRLRKTLAGNPPGEPYRAWALFSLALVIFRRTEVTADTAGLDEAIVLLEECRGLLGSPTHPLWGIANDTLASIYDRAGYAAGRDPAASAQRGYAWRVLLERHPAGARAAIRDAADDAVNQARRRLAAGGPADALRTLDAGRGLLLFAAIELHRIPHRLAAAGHPELAAAWRTGTPSDAARGQAMNLLAQSEGETIFDPPTLPEIRSALTRLDADALVYLVAGNPPQPGLAVMVPAVGLPAYMALPYLNLAPGTEVNRYLTALQTRDLRPAEGDGFAEQLDELCGWAWRTAMGPVLESYLPRLRNRPTHREPRVVLIPVGTLARVPWQAARRKDGRYAVELAAISQAASARLLCANAALPPVPVGPTGLVVGDPDTGERDRPLRSARLEAYAIRQAFYPGARYVGRLPTGNRSSISGAGTADQVRDWLTDNSPLAGAMLHLACHGYYAVETGAHLLLAGDGTGGSPATVLGFEELVDLLARVPDRRVALAVLAACNSGRSVYGYDEAYSLGTGFLAGGVRTVLSTQWSVPDAATSTLMFLFHHYLRVERLPPWQALRRAQIWMLDPDRQPPPEMPRELVPGTEDDPADVLAWAGFIHYGH
ncbi:MAG TPA: CHAT domain-containing protein [Micromonosporaceae bacterium]|nr:CHAT domain-containing protein [Micromonosporaceae bacterium]